MVSGIAGVGVATGVDTTVGVEAAARVAVEGSEAVQARSKNMELLYQE
jgi:hypothetical protein